MFRESAKIVIDVEDSPSASYVSNVRMEDLLEKLKLLNYDTDFVQELKMKPLNRHYFVIPTNSGEQFYLFTSLAAWLVRKAGKNFEQPQESDDPNAVIALIMDHVKEFGVSIEFPPNKLKQGVGEHAIYVLDSLADQAIKASKFKWKKDWRSHLEQMKQLRANISTGLNGTKNQLDKLHTDIANTLDKIKMREMYLNKQLEPTLVEFRSLQEELLKIKEHYRDVSGGVTERTRTLNKLSDELEQVKKEMDERGSSMTDGTPLINIKKTITKLKSEISEMNVRIGVLEYTLMCTKIRDRVQMQEDMNNTTNALIIK
ncbi:hypothetical protein G9C98_005674 [Cotesia typhae]|uniref:Uncharacterized protein n=1 Tax=Cotesia typhae TaxID=2053667 RepID=A0A8J5RDS1_9HYME|nr:hypothetical protein G9C98_005674 [Cotesia typhae]